MDPYAKGWLPCLLHLETRFSRLSGQKALDCWQHPFVGFHLKKAVFRQEVNTWHSQEHTCHTQECTGKHQTIHPCIRRFQGSCNQECRYTTDNFPFNPFSPAQSQLFSADHSKSIAYFVALYLYVWFPSYEYASSQTTVISLYVALHSP